MTVIDVFSPGSDCIGEGPLWSRSEAALYWVDIGSRRIYRKHVTDRHPRSWPVPDYPGSLAELAPGRIAVAMGRGVQQLRLDTGAIDLLYEAPDQRPGTRFNDGKVDPTGRFWAGTMQNNFAPDGTQVSIERCDGALYRFDQDGNVATVENNIGIANTLAWSPDLERFYFADSLIGVIFVYDFDAISGSISNKRTFFDASSPGAPDGSAIDVDGCLWNVRWDGSALLRLTPQGMLDRVIKLPIQRPTSCVFGGADLKTLFVTSSTNGLTATQLADAPLSGSVFAIQGVGQGLPVPPMTLIGNREIQ